jgi:hypothetical protein
VPDSRLLALFDAVEGKAAAFPGMRGEATAAIVRHVSLSGGLGAVVYSTLSADSAVALIAQQVDYFERLGQAFEWKVYGHDQPALRYVTVDALGR